MVEIYFDINGVTYKEMAIFDYAEDIDFFIKTFKDQVLEIYPLAINIRLGQAYVGLEHN